ncbi:apolipoprotein N-acyltransferase [Sulfurivirga sp.]|uniref:apolipoprotein N-acyltransferase n=1 Tax=Sulfurivirga sp. TaxID=2614236 RepID=UPI0025DC4217|nr:apolipoprotein N-acyltransferase [Sulfurivirga sp.]
MSGTTTPEPRWRYWLRALVPQRHDLLALVLGAVSVAGFAPLALAPLTLLALTGLFWLIWQADTPRQAARRGLWFGLGQFGVGASWLISSVSIYGGAPLPLGVAAVFLWVLYLSFYPALAAWLARLFSSRTFPVLGLLVIYPAAWVAGEWLRGHLFGGYPMLQVGVSHVLTWLDGYAPIFGVLGVSWAVALTAAALVWLAVRQAWIGAALLIAVVWLTGGSLRDVRWTEPAGDPVSVALLQGNVDQADKWKPTMLYPTLKRYVAMTREQLTADVIVWPETAVPAFFDLVEKGALKTFLHDARALGKDILLGAIWRDEDRRHYYNALINVGHVPYQVYRKYHLVLIGEYYPFGDLLKPLFDWLNIPFDQFTPGPFPPRPMKLGDHHAGMAICFETYFGDELRRQLPEADYFITVSNDAWFAHTLEPAQALQDVQMRAIELGRDFARATNTGLTTHVNARGEIVAQLPAYTQGSLRARVQPRSGLTPYARWGDLAVLMLLGAVFGFVLAARYLRGGLRSGRKTAGK